MNLPMNLDYGSVLNIGITGALVVLSLFMVIFVGGIAAYLYYVKIYRYKQFTIVVWRKDPMSGNIVEEGDQAGIFLDRASDIKGLWLRRLKIVMSPDTIPYVIRGKQKVVYLLKSGYSNYRYIKPAVVDGQLSFNLGEEDVNWGIYEYKHSHSQYILDNDWKQWVPYIGIFVLAFLLVFITIMLLKKFDVLAEVAQRLDHAAMVITNTV